MVSRSRSPDRVDSRAVVRVAGRTRTGRPTGWRTALIPNNSEPRLNAGVFLMLQPVMSFLCDRFRVPYALAAAVQAFSAVEKTVTSSGQEPTRRRVSRAGTPRRARVPPIDYRDGLSLCLTCSQETDITTVIQRYPQHPRRTAGRDRSEQVGRDPSEWVVAIVGMPTIDHGTPIESLNRIDGGKVDDDTHQGGKRNCGPNPTSPSVGEQGRSAILRASPLHRRPSRLARGPQGDRFDDAQGKDGKRKKAGNGPQGFRGLARGFDLGDAGSMKGRRGRDDDGERHQVGKRHPDIGIETNALQGVRALSRFCPAMVCRSGTALMSSTSCEACQNNKYGLMVVPRMATTVVENAPSAEKVGTNNPHTTSPHGTFTTIKVPK